MGVLPWGQDGAAWQGNCCSGTMGFIGKLKDPASKSARSMPDPIQTISGIKQSLQSKVKTWLWNTFLPSTIASELITGFYFKVHYVDSQKCLGMEQAKPFLSPAGIPRWINVHLSAHTLHPSEAPKASPGHSDSIKLHQWCSASHQPLKQSSAMVVVASLPVTRMGLWANSLIRKLLSRTFSAWVQFSSPAEGSFNPYLPQKNCTYLNVSFHTYLSKVSLPLPQQCSLCPHSYNSMCLGPSASAASCREEAPKTLPWWLSLGISRCIEGPDGSFKLSKIRKIMNWLSLPECKERSQDQMLWATASASLCHVFECKATMGITTSLSALGSRGHGNTPHNSSLWPRPPFAVITER